MKKTKCVSVRLESLHRISEKAYKACCFDGSEDILPASTVFGRDWDVMKSEAYWIAAWILPKKNLQWSGKKTAWFSEDGKMLPDYTVEHHTPAKKAAVASNELDELKR